jgi:hypothetical protein
MEGCFDQAEYVIPHYVPILFEKNALKAIWTMGLIRLHRVEGCKHLLFSDRSKQRIFSFFVDGRV